MEDIPISQSRFLEERVHAMRKYYCDMASNPQERETIEEVLLGKALEKTNLRYKGKIHQILLEAAKSFEKMLNRHGLSIYSYSLWKSYISCVKALSDSIDEATIIFAKELLRKVCLYVPLKNSDFFQIYQRLYQQQLSSQEIFIQYVLQFEQQLQVLDFNSFIKLEQSSFVVFDNVPSRYLATRLQYLLELFLELKPLPVTQLFCCVKLLSCNFQPYTDLVSELLNKNVANVFEKQPIVVNSVDKNALSVAFLQRGNDPKLQLAMSEVLYMLGRRDLQQIVNYQIFTNNRDQDTLLYLLYTALNQSNQTQINFYVDYIVQNELSVDFLRRILNVHQMNDFSLSPILLDTMLDFGCSQIILDLNYFFQGQNEKVNAHLKQVQIIQQSILKYFHNSLCNFQPEFDLDAALLNGKQKTNLVEFLQIKFENSEYELVNDQIQPLELFDVQFLSQYFFYQNESFGVKKVLKQSITDQIVDMTNKMMEFWTETVQTAEKNENLATLDYPPTTPKAISKFLQETNFITTSEQYERNSWRMPIKIYEVIQKVLEWGE
ncbi:Conserved_hypothetical protein [Hexamita inflata]|uniref:Uncharacterized protein n=1 Tax=Hexamita inflata TaxID=28002 RepID=A0AA86R4G9_9EUKA|nr:Conserved hypothetical protein [Hexamita inflata]